MTEHPLPHLHPPCRRCGARLSRGSVHVCDFPHVEPEPDLEIEGPTIGSGAVFVVLWIIFCAALYWIC